MYANFKETFLNTTLYMQNISDVSYVCIDASENLYVYSMYKFKLFGYDWTNVLLGALQNMLGKILTVNRIYNRIMEFDKVNDTINIYFYMGKIYRMLADFEPVILEESGFRDEGVDFDD